MEILLWLAVPLAITVIAMLCAAWSGRRRDPRVSDDRAQDRFRRAMTSPKKRKTLMIATQQRERSSGVALRPSHRHRNAR